MTPREAAALGKSLEPYDLFWLEDCTPGEDQDALRYVRCADHDAPGNRRGLQHGLRLPDAHHRASHRLRARGRDSRRRHHAPQEDRGLRRLYGIKTGFHGPTDVSPVGQAAHLHLDLALHNFGIQEYMRHSDATLERVPHLAARSRTACCTPASRSGLA